MSRAKKLPWLGLLLAGLTAFGATRAAAAESGAAALPGQAGIKGGLCLVVGARDTALASGLAAGTNLYVQVLQPDAKLAAEWGAAFAVADWRENAGVRSAAFDPEHYGSDLLNLILVEDGAALGTAKLADLCRILVPNGVVAFRSAPALSSSNGPGALAQDAGKLAMTPVSLAGFAAAFRKPVAKVDWKPCDSIKWRAGTRSQHCAGFAGFVVKDGTVSYQERMEVPGDIAAGRAQLFVRDAYNGRIVSVGEPSEKEPNWSATKLAAEIANRRLIPDPDKKSHWAGGCYKAIPLGKYILSHHNIWDNTETKERVFPYLVHPACFVGPIPAEGMGLIYNLPSRKESVLSGITALAPADIEFEHEPGGKVHQKFAAPPAGVAAAESDWPMFRAAPDRGNSVGADPGQKPEKAWQVQVGRGGRHYGIMSGERTGLTQPVSAWGLVVVADIDAQRIVALDAASGARKWVFHVGSRVDFSPTLYKGLCIFSAKDGWVYGLDATKGALVWKLLINARERFIGGQEKLESLWPACGDVLVAGGVGYASSGFGFAELGGVWAVGFKPETGEPVWGQCYNALLNPVQEKQGRSGLFTWKGEKGQVAMGGHCIDAATGAPVKREVRGRLCPADDYLAFGNSLARNSEDRIGARIGDGRLGGRIAAASADLTVAFTVGKDVKHVGRREYAGELNLVAAREPKKELWKSPAIELVVDDIVITPKQVYCVGHYERVKKAPELWVLSREDGKVLATVPVDGFPAFNGMSAAGDRLFVATRDGKLICYRSK